VIEEQSRLISSVTAPVNEYVKRLLLLLQDKEMGNAEVLQAFGLKSRRRLRETYIHPAMKAGLIEYTITPFPKNRAAGCRNTG